MTTFGLGDDYIIQERIDALQRLPWSLSSRTVMQMTCEDLDVLAAVRHDETAYWKTLNRIVHRIEDGDKEHVAF